MTEIAGRICLSSKSSLEYVTSFGIFRVACLYASGTLELSVHRTPMSRNVQCTLYYTQ